jgi:hypothetical protein
MIGGASGDLAERLDELFAGIVDAVSIEPPETKAKLRAPQLRVVKGVPNGLNNYCVPNPDGTKIILIGGLLYSFFLHYTRAAAAYFLPSTPNGPRPSPFWSQARSAVATTLEWISSPGSAPVFPRFDLTPHQEHVAEAFAALAFRFALCHEMAHIALEHVELGRVKDADFSFLQVSQQQELVADRFGLGLQVKSLDRTQLVTALASSVYFVHITGLLDKRLMLLAHFVDPRSWRIALTHPPAHHRVFNLMGAAQAFGDKCSAGLQSVHEALERVDGEIYTAAKKEQDSVANDAVGVLEHALTNISTVASMPATLVAAVTKDLRRLFDRSPLGVMRVLEPGAFNVSAASPGKATKLQVMTEQFASTLPPEFQRFRGLTRAQRAEEMA